MRFDHISWSVRVVLVLVPLSHVEKSNHLECKTRCLTTVWTFPPKKIWAICMVKPKDGITWHQPQVSQGPNLESCCCTMALAQGAAGGFSGLEVVSSRLNEHLSTYVIY
jgi:hypothetical protein